MEGEDAIISYDLLEESVTSLRFDCIRCREAQTELIATERRAVEDII